MALIGFAADPDTQDMNLVAFLTLAVLSNDHRYVMSRLDRELNFRGHSPDLTGLTLDPCFIRHLACANSGHCGPCGN